MQKNINVCFSSFSIQSQITQLWQQISSKFTELKDKDNHPPTTPLPPPHPDLIVFIFKSVYCDYNGVPTKQKLHIKSWISRLSKKAQTDDRSHKELSRSFFPVSFFFLFCNTTNTSKGFPVPLMFLIEPPPPPPPPK